MNALLRKVVAIIALLPSSEALATGASASSTQRPPLRQQRPAELEAEQNVAILQATVARFTSFGHSGIGSHHGAATLTSSLASSLTSAAPVTWVFAGVLVFIIIPTLIFAGCISLSSQMNSPGLVAGAVAVVLGKMTGRRGGQQPQPDQSEEGKARAASFHRTPPTPHMPTHAEATTPKRAEARAPSGSPPRRVTFAGAPSFASAPSSTISAHGRHPAQSAPDSRLPPPTMDAQAARFHAAGEPPSTPMYCEPANNLDLKGSNAQADVSNLKHPEMYYIGDNDTPRTAGAGG